MAQVTLRGNTFNTNGELPEVGSVAPRFTLVAGDLSEITSESLRGKKVVLNISPSIDTGVCATSVRVFNERIGDRTDAVVLYVSHDLPFAAARFCGAEGIDNVQTGSAFRSDFAEAYGVKLLEGPMTGLTTRAVVVLDESGTVIYTQLVDDIPTEPDYDAALAALG